MLLRDARRPGEDSYPALSDGFLVLDGSLGFSCERLCTQYYWTVELVHVHQRPFEYVQITYLPGEPSLRCSLPASGGPKAPVRRLLKLWIQVCWLGRRLSDTKACEAGFGQISPAPSSPSRRSPTVTFLERWRASARQCHQLCMALVECLSRTLASSRETAVA